MADLKKHPRSAAPQGPNRATRRRYEKVGAAAQYLGVNPATIRAMIADGRLTPYRLGRRVLRVDLNEIDRAMDAGGAA